MTMCPPEKKTLSNSRRRAIRRMAGTAGLGVLTLLSLNTTASAQATVIHTGELAAAVAAFSGGALVRAGRVHLDIAGLVDNGNVVPISVTVDSPMTAADHVRTIAVFNEKNPQRDVAKFTLGRRSGKAAVTTRIRLATTQKLVAVAQMSDGSFWSHTVDVIVTLAACIEGDS